MKSSKRHLLWLAAGPLAIAVPLQAQAERSLSADPVAGVAVNETVTVAGQDFYQYFMVAWRERDPDERLSILVHERPSARFGSQIWIESSQRRVFQAFLPTSRAAVRALGEQAADAAYSLAAEAEVERLLFRDPDLGPDEL